MGVLGRFHVGCRTVASDALIIKDAIARQLDIPILLLEWASFDRRIYNESNTGDGWNFSRMSLPLADNVNRWKLCLYE
jgi:hypothetical protein